MKLIYLDCHSGISGDMLLAALIDAGADRDVIQSKIDSLGVDDVRLEISEVVRKGFRALKVDIKHPPQHAHRHLSDIERMLNQSALSDTQRSCARQIFQRLAEAEAKVHGTTIDRVHFHEVGAIDSIGDIVGVAVALDLLEIQHVISSPVPTGTGTIRIAHGLVSVPAPATAELLKDVPIQATSISAELTTPTGAAFLAALADSFGPVPSMTVCTIGYGAGSRDLQEQANLLRVLVGESTDESDSPAWLTDHVIQLETNVDDVSAESIGYAVGLLERSGARDVSLIPVQMKKNRPGVILSLLCSPEDSAKMREILFLETGTLGIREQPIQRTILERRTIVVNSSFGPIEGKVCRLPNQRLRFSPEFESARNLAAKHSLPLSDIFQAAHAAFGKIPDDVRWPDV